MSTTLIETSPCPPTIRPLSARELETVAGAARELTGALRGLAHSKRGRPPRSRSADGGGAPLAELITMPADRLIGVIRAREGIEQLRHCHTYELSHDRRRSVLDAIEGRLRALGSPLGGPPAPFSNYETLEEVEILGRMRSGGAVLAAEIFAYEHYHRRRRAIMREAERRGGAAAQDLVRETSPRGAPVPAPFPEFLLLTASPRARALVRETLAGRPTAELEAALAYELATRKRKVILSAIRTQIKRSRTTPACTP